MFSNRYKIIQVIVFTIFLWVVLVGTAESHSYKLISADNKYITIENGDSLSSVFRKLSASTSDKLLLKTFLFLNNVDFIQAGHYSLVSKTWREFLFDIAEGRIKQFKIRIQEGSNLYELERLIQASPLELDCPNFKCLDQQFSFIEGTLMADTYFYKFNAPISTILLESQDTFIDYAESLWLSKNPFKKSIQPSKNAWRCANSSVHSGERSWQRRGEGNHCRGISAQVDARNAVTGRSNYYLWVTAKFQWKYN
ncbi:MAG: hypothetical protein ABS13_05435 [SAR86 cluster bacterium BACL1 MAG-121128-bin56]|nr:MAG: hypothetical protein ABS13_05435 [SAR86 cluster bacterium BACL1 MAG-121128-bin56]